MAFEQATEGTLLLSTFIQADTHVCVCVCVFVWVSTFI